jgi:ParB family transcriptional regulator, chromosome partitioning protein
MKKKVLGRGLEALIPEIERTDLPSGEVDVDRISTNPEQPRLHMDEQRLEELAASIRENGVLQPILVRPLGNGFQLVAGERRLAAAQRAGLLKIPATIRSIPDDRLLELALIENIQREQLNPIEEAQAFQRLANELSMTQEELAARLGKERSTVANALRLLKLPKAVKDLVSTGQLSPGHARALLSADLPPAEISQAAAQMVKQGWSVRDAERWAQRQPRKAKPPAPRDPNESAAEDRLRTRMGTKVEIRKGKKPDAPGHIRIYFYNEEDLVRIFSMLTE